jgi:two-component system cell cycle sensor histidine kinase PleC
MAKADAWGAPGGTLFGLRKPRAKGDARNSGAALGRLLAVEPILRRAIPTLIVAFLIVVGAARVLSLLAMHDEAERNAKAILSLAASGLADAAPTSADAGLVESEALLATMRERGMMSANHVLVLLDRDMQVTAANPNREDWTGRPLRRLVNGAEPLFTFGEGAGSVEVQVDGEAWFAAMATSTDGTRSAAALVPTASVFSEWMRSVKLNTTLFIVTAGVLLIILYAYHKQAARVTAADRIYVEAHQRIDLALVRGRCGLWDWDMARGRMYWSRSMYEMLGYRPRDTMLSFGDVDDIIHPDDQDLFELAQRIAAREMSQIDKVFRMRHADGQWVWVRARAQVVDPNASELHLIGIAVDVTEQQNFALKSATSDMRLSAAVECLSESFALWDAQNKLVLCNDRFQKDLGLSVADVAPGTSKEQIEAERLPYTVDRRLANANGPRGGASYERQLADGRWLLVNELKTPDGGVVAIGADITQLKQQQEKLLEGERRLMANLHDLYVLRKTDGERAEQLEELNLKFMRETERAEAASQAKSQFLANMSHELRTPLNAIIGFSEIMANAHFGPLGSDRYVEYAHDIHSSGQHLLNVINDILDMSRIEAGQVSLEREEIDLCPLISETARVIAVQAEAKSIIVETKIPDTMKVVADRRAVKQIVMNLLSNAVKFTCKEGKILVRAKHVSGALNLTIEDNGCGIPKAALKKLGRPFEQVQNELSRSHQGSGLGLAISRSLAELHGGALKIRSKEGKGTIVSVRIPVEAKAA